MNTFRRQSINDYIQTNGQVTYEELSQMYPEVSTMTLRRDIESLEKDGQVVKIRGGAKSVNSTVSSDDRYNIRAAANVIAKTQVAMNALKYIEPDYSIYFDSGSTMMLIATMIENAFFSVTTAAPNIALELSKRSKIDVNLLGGRVNRDTLSVCGIQAIEQIASVNVDTAIMSTSGFSADFGFTCGDYDEAQLKKAVVKRARKVILAMDSSKIDKSFQYTFARMDDIDIVVLDKKPSDILVEICEHSGVKLVY